MTNPIINETADIGLQATTTIAEATTTLAQTTTTLSAAAKSGLTEAINMLLSIRFGNPTALAALPVLLLILLWYVRRGGNIRKNAAFLLTRATIITLLVLAMAYPVLHESKTDVQEMPSVRIVIDQSPSMVVYGNQTEQLAISFKTGLSGMVHNATQASEKITIEATEAGEKTQLGDELYRLITTINDNSFIILLSDGNNNYGRNPADVARQLGRANATIYAIALQPEYKDVYVSAIRGDPKVTTPHDYQAEIDIASSAPHPTGYKLTLYADGVKITEMQLSQNTTLKTIPAKFAFNGEGIHTITAEITQAGGIKANDALYKTVEVVDKPTILLVTNKTESPFRSMLDELYDVTPADRVTDPEDYDVVILDDVNANTISHQTVEKLREYTLNGNGLIAIGGRNSYDFGNYNNSRFESLLPVLSMEKPVERRKKIAVMVLIDISGSTEYGLSQDYRLTPKIDFEKALAIKILRSLETNDSVGIIAFNTAPYPIASLGRLGERRLSIEDTIVKLKFGGGTDMMTSLETAENQLKYYAVNKYVIILSDGVIRTARIPETIEKARQLGAEGIKVYTVGVGFDTDETFMEELAKAGKGVYFKPEGYQRINIEFGRGLEEETPGSYAIDTRDPYHFITRNINVTAQITGYNRVQEKTAAQLLLATKSGNPVLTVWNFGLGRTAAYTADDGNEWAAGFYQKGNSKIMSATVNWVLGDLEKNKKVRITTQDTTLGETATIRIDAPVRPAITIGKDGSTIQLEAKATGINTYAASFKPNKTGTYTITATTPQGSDQSGIAANYPTEYSKLTPNYDELSTIARAANGRLIHQEELNALEQDIAQQMKRLSTKTTEETKPLYIYLAAAALLIYITDAVIKRIQEIRRLRE
ncbi:MAG: VWA domain-containing protein [Candidatus Altiarchaeota archaeon]|nr:VWA domain-containing protein [Candidatus Altiarchaeota archaeon]